MLTSIIGKLTWIKRALRAVGVLRDTVTTHNPHKINAAKICLRESPLLPYLGADEWELWTVDQQLQWEAIIRAERRKVWKDRKALQRRLKEKRRARLEELWADQGIKNTSFFRKLRAGSRKDPDGEAVWDKQGNLLTSPTDIRGRYGEYYANLLKGAEQRLDPPNENHRAQWMHKETMDANKRKLDIATKGISVTYSPPTVEEVCAVISKGATKAAGGSDRIQYGALQLLSRKTVKALCGVIGLWWRKKEILQRLVTVEICSLHKKGNNFDLHNKRGIGLVSKCVLIMEMVLIKRMTEALTAAGTRSKAQGGATPGVQTADIVALVINVITKARRQNRSLFMAEFDLYKFFDQIPHRAFVDAHKFFGFDDETIQLASLFWAGFKGRARSKFGYSEWFDVEIGNIQGLAGSPFRSCLVIDMFLLWMEREKVGFKFSSDALPDFKEHTLDDEDLAIYGAAWVDDVWLMSEDKDECRWMVERYNEFVSYYSMKFVPEKCHVYVLNNTLREEEAFVLTDYQGKQGTIPTISPGIAFRCLGVHFDLKLRWSGQYENDQSDLREFATTLAKSWSPAACTAKLVNTNGVSKITYALPLAEYKANQIRKLQGLLIKPVKKDGSHSNRIRYDAYSVPQQKGGYGVANVSAIYKASKIAVVQRLLNNSLVWVAQTTQMHLLDWQR